MKTAVLFKSKYGSTEQYAKWIAEELQADIYNLDRFSNKFTEYDTFIFCSATYMGVILAASFIVKNWRFLENKRVYLFNVGMIPWEDPSSKQSYEKLPSEIREKIGYIKVPGRFSFEKLNPFEKMISKAMKATQSVDFVKKENIQPVLDYVKQ